MSFGKICIYILMQFIGGILGAFTGWALTTTISCAEQYVSVQPGYESYQAFFAELAFTFMLITCFINMVEQKLDFFGIGIGFCLFASIGACGHISGCCLNPAVYIGTLLSATACSDNNKSINYQYFWVYIFSEILAAIMAGVLFKYIFSEERGLQARRKSTYHNVQSNRIQKYVTEFIGTFYLILFIKLCIGEHGQTNYGLYTPFYHLVTQQSIGFAVVMLLYTFGYIGGAHFNPVVTLIFYINQHSSMTNMTDFIMYIIIQFIGGLLGGFYAFMIGGADVGRVYISFNHLDFSETQAFFGEFIFTFLFSLVVANVACKQQGNEFAALAVGWSVFVCIGCAGPISGAALNPAVWFATYVSAEVAFDAEGVESTVTWEYSWIYTFGCMLASLAASLLHRYLYLPRIEDNNEDAVEVSVGDDDDIVEKIRRYLGEFIGTFFLVLIFKISLAEDGLSRGSIAQLTIGIGLVVLLYLFAWISGGHYNPMITLGVALSRLRAKEEWNKPNWKEISIYFSMQILGGIAGGFMAWGIANKDACNNYIRVDNDGQFTNGQAFCAEFVFTFFLIFVFVNIMVGQGDTQFFGLGIGACLIASIGSIAEISSCCLNPAVWIGTILPALACDSGDVVKYFGQIWVFIVPELLAAVVAGLLYHFRLSTEELRKLKFNKYMIEFIGTFFLIAVIKLAAGHNFDNEDFIDSNGIDEKGHWYAVSTSISIGFCLVAIVYAFGYISGGHFNPAVTLGLVARGGLDGFKDFPGDVLNVLAYIFAQILGGIAGGYFAWGISTDEMCANIFPTVDKANGYKASQAYFAETLCTFLLVFTICHVATKQFGNWFYGMAIGFTLFVSVNTIGQISGSCINPAVWIGTIISAASCSSNVNDITFEYVWIYVIGTTVGGIIAGLLFRFVYEPNFGDEEMVKYRMSIIQEKRERSRTSKSNRVGSGIVSPSNRDITDSLLYDDDGNTAL